MSLIKKEDSYPIAIPSVEELEKIEALAPGSTEKIIDEYLEQRRVLTHLKQIQDNRVRIFNNLAIKSGTFFKSGTFLSSLGILYSTFATFTGANLSDVAKVIAALATLADVFLYFSRPKK